MSRDEFRNVSIIIYSYLLNLNSLCKVDSLPDYAKSLKFITSENQFSLEILNVMITLKIL